VLVNTIWMIFSSYKLLQMIYKKDSEAVWIFVCKQKIIDPFWTIGIYWFNKSEDWKASDSLLKYGVASKPQVFKSIDGWFTQSDYEFFIKDDIVI
jgi:hypothetical protein